MVPTFIDDRLQFGEESLDVIAAFSAAAALCWIELLALECQSQFARSQ